MADMWTRLIRKIFRSSPHRAHRLLEIFGFTVLQVSRESDGAEAQVLVDYPRFPVVRSWWDHGRLRNLTTEYREAMLFRVFRDVELSPNRRGGFLRRGLDLWVADNGLPGHPRLHFPGAPVAGIVDQVKGRVLMKANQPKRDYESGIFVGSMATHNWFHWLIDNLPTLYLARYLPAEFEHYPVLVPDSASQRPNWRKALHHIVGQREVVYVNENEWVTVQSLVRIEGVTRPNPRPLSGIHQARVSLMLAPLLEYRDYILTTLELQTVGIVPTRRVFISRKAHAVRRYNDNEIFAVAAAKGFEEVYLEDLSFEESIRLFREAEFIVGPHGAGWANLLFCHSRAKALLWTWAGEKEDNWYENIAYATGVQYRQFFVTVDADEMKDRRSSDYWLDPALFTQHLDELVAAGNRG